MIDDASSNDNSERKRRDTALIVLSNDDDDYIEDKKSFSKDTRLLSGGTMRPVEFKVIRTDPKDFCILNNTVIHCEDNSIKRGDEDQNLNFVGYDDIWRLSFSSPLESSLLMAFLCMILQNVFVVGATKRPGRFDQLIYIPLPDEASHIERDIRNEKECQARIEIGDDNIMDEDDIEGVVEITRAHFEGDMWCACRSVSDGDIRRYELFAQNL
ncbi:hypothetical protein CLU79DRAFT_830936 [Phycomyces nitens]|nr:hypothetical protein CLU79DRAFT_830936 [Phycomyces nitens]